MMSKMERNGTKNINKQKKNPPQKMEETQPPTRTKSSQWKLLPTQPKTPATNPQTPKTLLPAATAARHLQQETSHRQFSGIIHALRFSHAGSVRSTGRCQ